MRRSTPTAARATSRGPDLGVSTSRRPAEIAGRGERCEIAHNGRRRKFRPPQRRTGRVAASAIPQPTARRVTRRVRRPVGGFPASARIGALGGGQARWTGNLRCPRHGRRAQYGTPRVALGVSEDGAGNVGVERLRAATPTAHPTPRRGRRHTRGRRPRSRRKPAGRTSGRNLRQGRCGTDSPKSSQMSAHETAPDARAPSGNPH